MGVVKFMVTWLHFLVMGYPFLHMDNPYLLFNEKLKQNSTFNAVEFHIDTKITEVETI